MDSLPRPLAFCLRDHGIEPAPERCTKMPWKTFLAAHCDGLAAADFFTVEVLTVAGLIRYVVLFVMKLKTRTVEIAGITSQPDELDDTGRTEPDQRRRRLPPRQYFILLIAGGS